MGTINGFILEVRSNRALLAILAANFVLHSIGFTWGLPNKQSWAIDSVVPVGMLMGLVKGFSFGYSWHYPMVHLLLLSILCIPVFIVAGFDVLSSHTAADVVKFFKGMKGMDPLDIVSNLNALLNIEVYATAMMIIARSVTVLMSVLMVYFVYRAGKELFNETAGIFSALVLTFNISFSFYSHFENVDVPYMFWGMIAFYYLVRIIKHDESADYKKCAIFTALSYGTKDQAYAMFVVPLLVYIFFVPLLKRSFAEGFFKALFRKNLIIFTLYSIVSFVIVENLLLNWNGFFKRIENLTGPNSKSYTSYTADPSGYTSMLKDLSDVFVRDAMPAVFTILAIAGVAYLVMQARKKETAFHDRLVFLYAIISFTIFFNFMALRAEMRFVLPQSVFASFYAGYAISVIREKLSGRLKPLFAAMLCALCLYGLYYPMSINANLLFDGRYEATEWMKKNIPDGTKMERYEGYAYLPQLPSNVREYQIKKDFLDIEKRKPEYIIISSSYYPRFFTAEPEEGKGYKIADRTKGFQESDQALLIKDLFAGKLNYSEEKRFTHKISFFRQMISTDHVILFKRKG